MSVHAYTRAFNGGQFSASGVESLTILGGGQIEQQLIPNAADQEIACAIDFSQLKSLFIKAAAVMTLETNSSGSPTDTIALKAGVPYIWTPGSYNICLITADVTKIFLTNASGAAALFEAYWGYEDVSP